jgi:hypothetical protein
MNRVLQWVSSIYYPEFPAAQARQTNIFPSEKTLRFRDKLIYIFP